MIIFFFLQILFKIEFPSPIKRILIRLLTNFNREWSCQGRQWKSRMCDPSLTVKWRCRKIFISGWSCTFGLQFYHSRLCALQTSLSKPNRIVFCNCRDFDVGIIANFLLMAGQCVDIFSKVGLQSARSEYTMDSIVKRTATVTKIHFPFNHVYDLPNYTTIIYRVYYHMSNTTGAICGADLLT